MKVKCKFNNLESFSEEQLLKRLEKYILHADNIGVDIGKEYIVYGIVFWDNCPWYYLCEDEDDEYPKPFAAEFFEVVDDEIPKNWKLSYKSSGGYSKTELVHSEWAKRESFYENLIEGLTAEVNVFRKIKKESLVRHPS